MSAKGEHDRILAAAARAELIPLGFWRKGRSRLWLADRGFWLAVVEFQPSGFSKGSYLNVAAYWLWSAQPHYLTFSYSLDRQKPWIAFENAEQFTPLAEALARQAAEESRQLQSLFADIRSTAATLIAEEDAFANAGRGGGWPAFDAAVASGLAGEMGTSRKLFGDAYDSLVDWRPDFAPLLAPYAVTIAKEASFRAFIEQRIHEQRARYGLGDFNGLSGQSDGC